MKEVSTKNKINAEQLVSGISLYLQKEILPCIEDTFTKIAVRTFTITAEKRIDTYKNAFNNSLKSPFMSEFLQVDEDGCFDVEMFIDALRQSVNEYGELVVKIPPVKFVSPEEKVLRFNANDISNLKQYLTTEVKEKNHG